LGKSERRALASYLRNLVMHLLKWEFHPERRTGSWRFSIDNARAEIHVGSIIRTSRNPNSSIAGARVRSRTNSSTNSGVCSKA
jgi:hypothetical protein